MIIKSPDSNIEIPETGLCQYILSNQSGKDDEVIFTDGITDEKLTYGDLKRNFKRFAAGLIDKAGFERGNVLAIVSTNKVLVTES